MTSRVMYRNLLRAQAGRRLPQSSCSPVEPRHPRTLADSFQDHLVTVREIATNSMRHAEGPARLVEASGATISLVVARRPATDPTKRVGPLFYNPGGLGDGAAKYIASAETIFTPTLIERFDLVGMDPRGIENSSQVQCTLPVITPETTLFPKTEQQLQQLLKHNREGWPELSRPGGRASPPHGHSQRCP